METAQDVLYRAARQVADKYGYLGPYEELKQAALLIAEELIAAKSCEEHLPEVHGRTRYRMGVQQVRVRRAKRWTGREGE